MMIFEAGLENWVAPGSRGRSRDVMEPVPVNCEL